MSTFPSTTLTISVSKYDTNVTVNEVEQFPIIHLSEYYYLILSNTNNTFREIIKVVAVHDKKLIISRAQFNTLALDWNSGTVAQLYIEPSIPATLEKYDRLILRSVHRPGYLCNNETEVYFWAYAKEGDINWITITLHNPDKKAHVLINSCEILKAYNHLTNELVFEHNNRTNL